MVFMYPSLQYFISFLPEHYEHHWYPQAPCRGSGYRCLRINHRKDPLIGKAASAIGITQEELFSLLPSELTLWVDPNEVSYRIGENGSICVLYKSSPPAVNTGSTDQEAICKGKLRTEQSKSSKRFSMMTSLG